MGGPQPAPQTAAAARGWFAAVRRQPPLAPLPNDLVAPPETKPDETEGSRLPPNREGTPSNDRGDAGEGEKAASVAGAGAGAGAGGKQQQLVRQHQALSGAPRSAVQPRRLIPKTLVLDLDETLIHSTSKPGAGRPPGLKVRLVEVVLDGRSTVYTVYKRPWVDYFLRKVSSWYTVVIFTASLPEYADPVIDWLDGGDGSGGLVHSRLFRSDCIHSNGSYLKDLSVVDSDLSRVCLVDNSPASYAINPSNGIPIEGWINDPEDECLLDLLPVLDSLRFTNDVRRVLGLRGFGRA